MIKTLNGFARIPHFPCRQGVRVRFLPFRTRAHPLTFPMPSSNDMRPNMYIHVRKGQASLRRLSLFKGGRWRGRCSRGHRALGGGGRGAAGAAGAAAAGGAETSDTGLIDCRPKNSTSSTFHPVLNRLHGDPSSRVPGSVDIILKLHWA